MTGFIALCGVLGKLHEINLSGCHLGPASAAEFAKAVSDADAAVKKINLSGCPLTGAATNRYGDWENIDSDMTGFIALCGVLGKLIEINLSGCHLGPASATELAKAVSDAEAALAHLAICQNKIGSEGGTALVEAIKTSNLESISIGKDLTLPIKGELDSPTLDASDQDIDPGYVIILAWWLTTPACLLYTSPSPRDS